MFGSDGYIYRKDSEKLLNFKYINRVEIINFIRNQVERVLTDSDVYNFYLTNFDRILFPSSTSIWTAVTNATNIGTGYFQNIIDNALLKVGTYSTSGLKYIAPGASVKFTAPAGYHFMKDGTLMAGEADHAGSSTYKWVRVVSVAGDGTNAGRGALSTGLGPIVFNDQVPTGSIATTIVPRFVNDISSALEIEMTNQVVNNQNFGLRYDSIKSQWVIVQNQNLDLINAFSLGKTGDTTNENLDASWVVAFIKDNDQYIVRVRTTEYVFGSLQQNRFYFDKNEKAYNNLTGELVKDTISVLGINATSDGLSQLSNEFNFEISDTISFDDGYESTKEIKLSFSDSDDDGVVDDPDAFIQVAGSDLDLNFLFFKQEKDSYGTTIFNLIDNSNNLILVYQKQSLINVNDFTDGQLIYFYDSAENNVKRVDRNTNTLILDTTYTAYIGRRDIKFQYTHAASEDRRIDPSVTNIVDMFILTRSYDTAYRNWLAGATATEPVAPTTDSLRIDFGGPLSTIKSISDEIVYHPVKYKVLFGTTASENLQARFKVVKNPNKAINDNNLKVRIVNAINEFFDVNNWDFGDRFYLSELTTYVINSVSPDVTNFVIVPRQTTQQFGNLFEIQSKPDEIFANGAKVDDIEIVTSITAAEIGISSTSSSSSSSSNGGTAY